MHYHVILCISGTLQIFLSNIEASVILLFSKETFCLKLFGNTLISLSHSYVTYEFTYSAPFTFSNFVIYIFWKSEG